MVWELPDMTSTVSMQSLHMHARMCSKIFSNAAVISYQTRKYFTYLSGVMSVPYFPWPILAAVCPADGDPPSWPQARPAPH